MLRSGNAVKAAVSRGYATAALDGLKTLKISVQDGIAVIKIDQPGSKVNTLGADLSPEFEKVFDSLNADQSVKAAVLISGKPDGFIAGADIEMLRNCKTSTEAEELSLGGQRMLNKVANGRLPVVAAIHGAALGGGLEVALACHYRIATKSPTTKLGLPEVMLGLLPGAGGTQRLPRLIGIQEALPMVLTGKEANAVKAKKIGIVDALTEQIGLSIDSSNENTVRNLEAVAIKTAKDIASGKLKIDRSRPYTSVAGLTFHATNDIPKVRDFVLGKAKEMVMKQTKGLYPAPLEILNAVKTGLDKGIDAGHEAEARGFGELTQTSESKSLIGLFFGRTACKKLPAKYASAKAMPVSSVGVLGAGLMGAGIAEVSLKKFDVTIKDATDAGLARGIEQIESSILGKVKRKRLTQFEADKTISGIATTTGFDNFDKVDIVIEAVPEIMELKHKVVKELEQHTKPTSIFATNTSALPIADIAKASSRPERVIGMHYFSPVPKMQLLEIIPHEKTLPEVTATAFDIGTKQGKTCIIVKDVPGFYVNRSLGPYMAECMRLVGEGCEPQALDKALTGYGFPIGPIALADEVGIDVAGNVQKFLASHLGKRMESSKESEFLYEMINKGWLGRKTGKGFFLYPKGGKGKRQFNPEAMELIKKFRTGTQDIAVRDLQQRPTFMFMNEAAICLQDEIILSPTDGDIGLVFGVGFPPPKGGPFRFFDSYGVQNYVDQMYRYRDEHGERFEPAQILKDYAKEGKLFFPN